MAAPDRQSAIEWDARAELDVGLMIKRYLAENPPPKQSRVADDLERWAEGLEDDGRARLQAAGRRRLRSAYEERS